MYYVRGGEIAKKARMGLRWTRQGLGSVEDNWRELFHDSEA